MLHRSISGRLKDSSKPSRPFEIFERLQKGAQYSDKPNVNNICDEILSLSLMDLAELTKALNDPKLFPANTLPLQASLRLKNRSPFPHPKHLFAGVDADSRSGMHTVYEK